MRVFVCGGRDYGDEDAAWRALDAAHAKRKFTLLMHGAATGADTIAGLWADARGVATVTFPANWSGDGRRAAGPIRNQRMLDIGKPEAGIAFPGNAGTADMVRRAEAAGLKVWRPFG